MCSVDVTALSAAEVAVDKPFSFILSASLRLLHMELKTLTHFNLFAAFAATPAVHVRLHNLHVPIWFPLNHFPSERLNPRINFLRPFHNEGETHKNQTALSKNTSAAKPNQAMCLFTFPAMAICLRINRLRLRWTVRIQSISWCPHTHTQFSSRSRFLTHTHRSPEIAF